VKWVFLLCLLVVGGVGGAMGGLVGYRWLTSMQAPVKLVPGDLPLAPPGGTVPREGGEAVVGGGAPAAMMALYANRPNPVRRTPESVARGETLFRIYCTPCHGATGKGDGLVTPRFIPPPDLSSPQIQGRTDGHIAAYIGYGGALMPPYGEAVSLNERWDLVNYVRSLAKP
jgi:S-disulfanyl-L-cysteine oxidoreductase SoxD